MSTRTNFGQLTRRKANSSSQQHQVKFRGYNEATEGIIAQQREADRRLKQIKAKQNG
jgi:hypothetical protein